MDYTAYLGRCLLFFFIAVFLDAAGLILFFVGIFAPLSFWDFFVFSGPLIIFLSLVFWIFWYLGNLDAPMELLPKWDSRLLRLQYKAVIWQLVLENETESKVQEQILEELHK